MKLRNNLQIAVLALAMGGGFLTSCTNELNEPALNPTNTGAKLLRAPEIYAWSGNHTFGVNSRGEVIEEYYEVMPDFTEWCNTWADFNQWNPAVPENAVTITADKYYTTFEEGGCYLLDGVPANEWEGIILNEVPDNVTFYVKGYWQVFGVGENPGKNIKFVVLEKSELIFDQYEEDPIYLKNMEIYNYGSLFILDSRETINEGCIIYNAGKMVVEQNYVDDNTDKSLDPIVITQPIYSTGECYFSGGVQINTSDTYFRKVCVDGQMTVGKGQTVHTGYLNADELYGHDGSKVEMAPEGMIVAGTIIMKASARVASIDKEKGGFILTNEIIGIRKTNGTVGSKMESEVDAENFSTIFENVDIYVTDTINNSQDLDEIKTYKATNGTTYPLNTDVFDASENDDVRNGDVNGFDCGIGYRYAKKRQTPQEPEQPGTGEQPEQPEQPTEPEQPEQPEQPELNTEFTEVEINLSLNDSHDQYAKEDLVSKLSIHVRYAGDVEVFIPVPKGYYCDADDFAIRGENNTYLEPQPESISYYEIAGKTVTLTVAFEEGGIRVTTDGIDQDVLDYCYEHYGDGVNFEIYNYYGLYEETEDGYVRAENGNIAREVILGYLNQATVEFLDNPYPDYYINAFHANAEGEGDHDCSVSIIGSQSDQYPNKAEGEHLNGSEWNQIYSQDGVNPQHSHVHSK